eukprot:CAMPEP_0181316024 /NCGR_PEP_ID=MMETSP1101-20121128/15677_1 /TAXON_ID=46948 /ORGANISM="Rhodomonas abbreviata, Strain Caron Lab Isolate" /LENGTH=441 /DNA_ID=CAMNT_0023423249 /DNA_START=41 /DNA_END=1366 /DNA_ORIENTATION=-
MIRTVLCPAALLLVFVVSELNAGHAGLHTAGPNLKSSNAFSSLHLRGGQNEVAASEHKMATKLSSSELKSASVAAKSDLKGGESKEESQDIKANVVNLLKSIVGRWGQKMEEKMDAVKPSANVSLSKSPVLKTATSASAGNTTVPQETAAPAKVLPQETPAPAKVLPQETTAPAKVLSQERAAPEMVLKKSEPTVAKASAQLPTEHEEKAAPEQPTEKKEDEVVVPAQLPTEQKDAVTDATHAAETCATSSEATPPVTKEDDELLKSVLEAPDELQNQLRLRNSMAPAAGASDSAVKEDKEEVEAVEEQAEEVEQVAVVTAEQLLGGVEDSNVEESAAEPSPDASEGETEKEKPAPRGLQGELTQMKEKVRTLVRTQSELELKISAFQGQENPSAPEDYEIPENLSLKLLKSVLGHLQEKQEMLSSKVSEISSSAGVAINA